MKCVLLAAGYATRLYPLTRDVPKSLLRVGSRTILERILEKIEAVPDVDEVVLVTNSRFYGQFAAFFSSYRGAKQYTVLDDGTSDNGSRLGAVADLALAVERRNIAEDILVLAGDNLFDFALSDFVAFFNSKGTDCISAHRLEDLAELRRTGVAVLDADGKVLLFQEKPREPASSWAVPPFYLYRRGTLPLLRRYLDSGENPDAPGNFVPWLSSRAPVHAFVFTGRRYDIGTLESYEEAKKLFSD